LLKRPNNNYLDTMNNWTYKKKPNGHYFIYTLQMLEFYTILWHLHTDKMVWILKYAKHIQNSVRRSVVEF
jgi:hypothetical protein